jgi:hypothetical protein
MSNPLIFASTGFTPLLTGSGPLDQLLSRSRVPKGTLVYLDAPENPIFLLLALTLAAIERGEHVAFLYVPTMEHMSQNDPDEAAMRAGDFKVCPLGWQIELFGLEQFVNAQDPTDPGARLRYFVANTPDEFQGRLDALLTTKGTAPDLIVVYGLEQLYQDILPIFPNCPPHRGGLEQVCLDALPTLPNCPPQCEGDEEAERVQTESLRLRRALKANLALCRQRGTTLYLSRTMPSTAYPTPTLLWRTLTALLNTQCPYTLVVERGNESIDGLSDEEVEATFGRNALDASLYQGDALQGRAQVLVSNLKGDPEFYWDGSFVETETDVNSLATGDLFSLAPSEIPFTA